MKKTDLVQKLSSRLNRTNSDVKEVVEAALEEILDAVSKGEKVSLLGFGTFQRLWTPPRRGRHPKTGRLLDLHPRFTTRFTPGTGFEKRLKNLIPVFDSDPDHVKARRVARTLAADLRLYHKAQIEDAQKRGGQLGEELEQVLSDARSSWRERVSARVRAERDYLEEELAALFRHRRNIHGPVSSPESDSDQA